MLLHCSSILYNYLLVFKYTIADGENDLIENQTRREMDYANEIFDNLRLTDRKNQESSINLIN
jgi:hypothetical protein